MMILVLQSHDSNITTYYDCHQMMFMINLILGTVATLKIGPTWRVILLDMTLSPQLLSIKDVSRPHLNIFDLLPPEGVCNVYHAVRP
jgi:hypothetical protein